MVAKPDKRAGLVSKTKGIERCGVQVLWLSPFKGGIMSKLEQVIGAHKCIRDLDAPCDPTCEYYDESELCNVTALSRDTLEVIENLKKTIATYEQANTFLAAHGWRWNNE